MILILKNIFDELSKKGNKVGKPLKSQFFREKKIQNRRIYFLVYEEILVVLVIAQSDKKHQQETIEEIKKKLDKYKYYVYKNLT